MDCCWGTEGVEGLFVLVGIGRKEVGRCGSDVDNSISILLGNVVGGIHTATGVGDVHVKYPDVQGLWPWRPKPSRMTEICRLFSCILRFLATIKPQSSLPGNTIGKEMFYILLQHVDEPHFCSK